MFSRTFLIPILVLTALTGCSFRKNPPDHTQLNISAGQLGCLDGAGTQLKSFIQGTATADQVKSIWNCASEALQEFSTETEGADSGSYSAQELQAFLSKYFVRKIKLTDDLVEQVGVLKQALVGGDPDRLTVGEIHRLQLIFSTFRDQSVRLLKYMPMTRSTKDGSWSGIGGRRWRDLDSSYLDRFENTLVSVATQIGGVLQYSGNSYSFADFDRLLGAALNALPDSNGYQGTRKAISDLRSNLNLVATTKGTLLAPDPKLISSGDDWKELLTTSARWGAFAVRLAWYMDPDRRIRSGETPWTGAGLQNLRGVFDELQGILIDVVKRHPGQVIGYDELEKLIDVLPSKDLPASAASINLTWKPLIQRIIGGLDPGPDGRAAQGITPGVIGKIHGIFYNWYEGQRFLGALYSRLEIQNGDSTLANYPRDTLLNSGVAIRLWNEVYQQTSIEWNETTRLAARRIEEVIRALPPLFQGQDSEISFPRNRKDLRYSFHDLSELNWMQTLSLLMLRGYATEATFDPLGIAKPGMGVTYKQFQQFFDDFKPLGISLKLFDPDDPNAAFSRFREGDVFTYASDGNGMLDLDETTALLAFAVSADRKAARIHAVIASQCPNKPHADKYGQALIEDQCYRTTFFAQLDQLWNGNSSVSASQSGLLDYFHGLNPVQLSNFEYLLEEDGRKKGYKLGTWFDSGDTQGLVAALQYIEAIFTRYDPKGQGVLTPSDAGRAFPKFKRTLEQMGRCMQPPTNLSDTQADLIFTYMLDKGKIPGGSKLQKTLEILGWGIQKYIPFAGHFKADRIRILEIFAALAKMSRDSASSNSCSESY